MKKFFALAILLIAAWIVYANADGIRQWLARPEKGLSVFHIPSDILSLIERDASLFPSPLRNTDNPAKSNLTRTGVMAQTNLQRRSNGLAGLKGNAFLDKDAEMKLKDMFTQQYFEHISPEGVAPSDLAQKAGYKYIIVGENLALGNFVDDKALVEAWMNSPGHRANILNKRYQEIGVAVGKGIFNGQTTWLAVQSFGTPQSACPGADAGIKRQIEENQVQITQLMTALTALKNKLEQNNYATREDYNRDADRYNSLVSTFNSLVETTKQLISQYNAQVQKLNECIAA
jgi:uncharacterized protein YkwD